MAVQVARLEAVLSAETRDFDKAMNRSEGTLGKVGKAAGLAGAAIAAGLVVGGKQAIAAASNLGESINAVNVVFGKAGQQILDFSKKAGTEAGLSMRAFNELVTPIGASLQNVGLGADAAAKASINLAKRAADMASVFNVDVKDALGAIQAGLRGEADPLERFGVGLSAAAVQAKAMEMGLVGAGKEMDASAKAQARLALIMEQTNKVAGDFTNTSGSMANQQRIMKAEFENVSAAIGQKLLPMVTKVLSAMLDMISWVSVNWPKLLAIIGPTMDSIKRVVSDVLEDVRRLWDEHGTRIMQIATTIFTIVKQVVENAMRAIQGVVNVVMGILTGDWQRAWDGIKGIVGAALDTMLLLLRNILPLMGKAALAIGTGIKNGVVDGVTGLAGLVWDLVNNIGARFVAELGSIKGWGSSVGSAIKKAVVDALVGIGNAAWEIVNNIGSVISDAAGTIRGWGSSVGNWIKNAVIDTLVGIGAGAWGIINNIWEFVSDRAGQVKGWGTSIGTWIKEAIVDGFTGLANAIWDHIKGGLQALKDRITGFLGKFNPIGDPVDPGFVPPTGYMPPSTGSADLKGALEVMRPFAQGAGGYGLYVSSGLRSPEYNKAIGGSPTSDHLTGKAIDVSGSAAGMAGFFRSLIGNPSVKQAFYDPLGSIFGGRQNVYREGGHDNHVHVATYDKGGYLPKGWSIAGNFTGGPERVGGSGGNTNNVTVNGFVGNPSELARKLRDMLTDLERANGRHPFGRTAFS